MASPLGNEARQAPEAPRLEPFGDNTMAKSNARKSAQAQAANLKVMQFDVAAWREELNGAALQFDGAAIRLLKLALAARGLIDKDLAREAFKEAFGGAFAATRGVSFDEAVKSKTVQNRVSDALAVWGAENLPGSMPDQLQAAAKACREANPKGSRKPRAGGKAEKDAKAVALGMIHSGLEQLRHAVGDDADVLAIVAELADLVGSIEEALGVENEEDEAA
ncbi:hypothetical protein D3C81_789030 [compost metagenome]